MNPIKHTESTHEKSRHLPRNITDLLANRLMQAGVVPESEPEDAAHIAMATLHGFRYLVTWNFAHFVGPDAKYRVFAALRDWGYAPALFATPEELLEGSTP